MNEKRFRIHAREQVLEYFEASELDRLVQLACAAAERSERWCAGQEFIFELTFEPYDIAGFEWSAFIVCHRGDEYEIFYYDGPMAETISARPSWKS